MPIEVRQLLVRAMVDPLDTAPTDGDGVSPQALEQLKEELLAECKAWLTEQLRQSRER